MRARTTDLSARPSREASDQRTGLVRASGRSSDSWALPWPGVPTGRRLPRRGAQCLIGPLTGDGVRSHSPLRGSPGIAPGSLLPHRRRDLIAMQVNHQHFAGYRLVAERQGVRNRASARLRWAFALVSVRAEGVCQLIGTCYEGHLCRGQRDAGRTTLQACYLGSARIHLEPGTAASFAYFDHISTVDSPAFAASVAVLRPSTAGLGCATGGVAAREPSWHL